MANKQIIFIYFNIKNLNAYLLFFGHKSIATLYCSKLHLKVLQYQVQ